ncbi:putative ribonuclease H-like domain-containing protein [Tanacetum coccineum]
MLFHLPLQGYFHPPNLDLSNAGLEEFQQHEFEGYVPKTSKSVSEDTSNKVKESPDAPLVEELVSNDKLKKKIALPTYKIEFVRPKQQEKPVKPKAVNTARPNTGVVNAVRENQVNAVKVSACWVWRPTKPSSASITLKRHNYVDARGRSKSGTCPISQASRNLNEDMLPLGEEPKEGKLRMCDKKNSILFTDTGCFVLSPDFKLSDESQVLLKVPIKNNMYSVDMKNIVPKESLTCLVAKATLDESMLWHRRRCHVNFITVNKLVKDNLVRGLPTKLFENDQTCVACLKGKQHKASCNSNIQNSITQPLFMLHMDLFGLIFVSNSMMKKYCLVVTDDYSRFTWVFFLATKDETSGILKSFITMVENLVDKTPQQNDVAKRRNRTLIKAARTMLADSKLPTTFWAEAVNTACYVQNRVLVVKPYNKTPYEIFRGKFDGKSDEGFFVGYSLNSKAFRVYNIRTRKVEENLHIRFLEDKPIIAGDGPKWLFDIDVLTKLMNYVLAVAGTNSNDFCTDVNTGSLKLFILVVPTAFPTAPPWKPHLLIYLVMKTISGSEQLNLPTYQFSFLLHIQCIHKDHSLVIVIGYCQMDVKSAFLYGKIEEEVYVCQPPGFEDLEFPDRVYKTDKTLFIKRVQGDILLVQVYVDDIIFGSTRKEMCTEFEKMMHKKFQMSSMRELTFFFGLQVTQKDDGIFISQDKYMDEMLKKFGFTTVKTASTPMETSKPLLKDTEAKDFDVHL